MNLPQFHNQQLLITALTHRSALNENISAATQSNERLEFLGDAVLELITTDFLYLNHPQQPEGVLTAYRSALVKTTTLALIAKRLGLGEKLYMSKGEEATGGRDNQGLLADSFEAFIGALYLDQGLDPVKKFLEENLFIEFDRIKADKLYRDAKSLLQETVQAKGFETPTYEVLKSAGPDHDKIFTVQVIIDGQAAGVGEGKSKQEAQQQAAQVALEKF